MTVAGILREKKVAPAVSLIVAPGSRQVFEMIARNGALADMIAAGARIMESACGFCIGAGQAPTTDGVSLRTNNRNFEGRSGTASAAVYLVSPETAALSAVAGSLVDPLDARPANTRRSPCPRCSTSTTPWSCPPAEETVTIVRGPNIGEPPFTAPLMDEIRGVIGLKVGDKITTDHIMPAGPRLKYRSNIPAYAEFVFENVDPEFSRRALADKDGGQLHGDRGRSKLRTGLQPRARGHLPHVPGRPDGDGEVLRADPFRQPGQLRDHSRSCSGTRRTTSGSKAGDEFSAAGLRTLVMEADEIPVTIAGKTYLFTLAVSQRQRAILLEGGLLNYTRKRFGS